MNLILIDPQELTGDSLTLTDRRAEHIRTVLRSKTGDTIRIGLLDGPLGQGRVVEITKQHVSLATSFLEEIPPVPPLDIILALPRPIMLKRVLAQAASLGVARIYIINAGRVEKSYFHSALVREENFRNFLLLGLEQAMDTRIPHVSLHPRFRPFIEDALPEIAADTPLRLVAHPEGKNTLAAVVPLPLQTRVLLAIGPEGGWSDFEIEKFVEQGFTPFSLGPRILRVDTAVPALMSQLALLRQL
jgi:RsmE family RNA methyltransferase